MVWVAHISIVKTKKLRFFRITKSKREKKLTLFGDGLKNLSFCVTLPWKRDEDLPFFTGGFFCKHLTHWAGGQLFASRGAFACALRAPAHGNVYKKTSLVPVKWPVKKWCFCRKRQMVKRVI